MRSLAGLLLVSLALVSTASCACEAVGACAPATFLILDEDALDNGLSTVEDLANNNQCGFGDPAVCVNDDIVTDWTGRTALFSRQPTAAGTQFLIPGGQVGDEGWFTATQGFNAPITVQDYYDGNISDESDLDETDGIFALGNAELNALVGKCVCAVVYDSDISMIGPSEANLQGATLGLIAFQVVNVIPPGSLPESGSSDSLNDVLIELADTADVPALCQVVPLDVEPPVITCPADLTVECSQAGGTPASNSFVATWLSSASATDNCSPPTVTSDAGGFFPASCPPSSTTVTFTATDSQSNSAQCTASLTVVDSTMPTLTGVPADTSVECDNIPPIANPTVSDVCDSAPSVSSSESTVAGACSDDYTLLRMFTAIDSCGNQLSQTQEVTVSDNTPPVLSSTPGDVTAECDAVPAAATLTATDNCDSSPTVTMTETSAAGSCSDSFVLTRTWTAVDACGNSASNVQVVTVDDTTAPSLVGTPPAVTIECDVALPATAVVTATDNCDSNPSVSVAETTAPGACPEEFVLTRTWTAVDVCGNSATSAQEISVVDTTAPTMAGTPADTSVECDAGLPQAATVTALDNCDNGPAVTMAQTSAAGSCADETVVTRTWSAVDACGNTASYSQTINVIDTTSPVLSSAPADLTVECDSIPALATVTATDNCDSNPVVTPVETVAAGSCADESILTRTWTAVDACGNSASYAQTITVVDTTSPVLAGTPADTTIECDDAVPLAPTVTASDNCDSSPTVNMAETNAAGACAQESAITRTWTAVDACGNSVNTVQIITVVDTTSPVLAGTPADTVVECDAALPATAAVTASDNCDSNPIVTVVENSAAGACAQESTVTRTWTAVDACGNTVSYVQTISVVDTTAPALSATPSDATVECSAIPDPAAVTTSDNCDSNPSVSMAETTAAGACADESTITRTWTAVDACGNSISHVQTLTVVDTTAPVLSGTPSDTTVECDAGLPATATVTASDNCDTNISVGVSETTAAGSCADESVVTRTWSAVDVCGNSASYAQTITVVDTTPPVLSGTPTDATVECDAVPVAPTVTASDNCDLSPAVTLMETNSAGACAEEAVITRAWTGVDACGNSVSFVQTITVVDTTAPVLANTPADETIECDVALPALAVVTASDNCDAGVAVTANDVVSPGSCPHELVSTRTWSAVDNCGNSVSFVQTITVVDTTAPALVGTPADLTIECDVAIPGAAAVTATDNCDASPVVSLSENTIAGACAQESVLVRTWTGVDACGNSVSSVQTITSVDTTPPVLSGTPVDETAECDAIPPSATVTASDNCDVSASVTLAETSSAGSCADESVITRAWMSVDACGNSVTFTQTITVVDTTPPVLSGTPVDATVECDAIPNAAIVTSSDNCDASPTVNLVETVAAGACADESVITRTWTAVDACGNSASYSQAVTVVDTTAPVLAGTLPDETVECDAIPSSAAVTVTDNCDSTVAVTVVETTAAGSCPDESVITRTWNAVDVCGNSVSYTQTLTVIDTTAPTMSGTPSDATIECDVTLPVAAPVTASDNCDSSPTVSLVEATAAGACAHESVLTRTWTAVDACANSVSFSQTITVVDTTAPVLAGTPADATVECDAVPTPAVVTASDNCDTGPALTVAETTEAGVCTDDYVLTRTWNAVDACGNSASYAQIITVMDTTAPILSGAPADMTLQCAAAVPVADTLTASDNCAASPAVNFVESVSAGPCADNFVTTRTWTAVDACGNTVSHVQTITVADTTDPVLSSTPADTTIECDSPVPVAETLLASDNCAGSPAVAFAETVAAGSCADESVITRTWTAVDNCGNSVVHTQTVTVVDTTSPVLDSTPADTTLECDVAVPVAPARTASDNCDQIPTVTLVETVDAGQCAQESVTTRTWTALDSCGNSVSDAQTITVVDTTAPVLAGTPADVTLECDVAVPIAAAVTASDNCDVSPTLTVVETTAAGSCADESVVTRTWTTDDACGNSASYTQTITIVDSTSPVLAGTPSDTTVECDAVPPAAAVTASDSCDVSVTLTVDEAVTAGSCADESVISRTWLAVDVCGNSVSYTQTITVMDTTAPQLVGTPADATVECDAVPPAATVTAIDNCDSSPVVNAGETTSAGACTDEFLLTRTWSAVDVCGNSVSFVQTVTVVDTTSPVLAGTPADETVECDLGLPTPATVTASDNCDSAPVVSVSETTSAGACADESVVTRSWAAVDACGNSVSFAQTITVQDTTAPVLSATPADVTIECDTNMPAPAAVTASDNCDISPVVTLVETTAAGACTEQSVTTRAWTAVDTCGNAISSTQTITVVDTTAPVLANTPADATVECTAPTPAAVTATDNCDASPAVNLVEAVAPGQCAHESVVTRTWTAVDSCGNSVSFVQTVTVEDNTPPVLSGTPADASLECDIPLPAIASVVATDNCDSNPIVTVEESVAPGNCPDASIITRTWTAVDACGNSVSFTQTITVDDTTAPVLNGTPDDATVFHGEVPPAAPVTASDNCDNSPQLDFVETELLSDCGSATAVTRTWTATDACGNSVTHTQTITIVSAPCTCPGGTCSSATFLILDEDAIDNDLSTIENLANAGDCGFGDPAQCVNDDTTTDWTKRTPLFSRQPTAAGTQILIPGGQVQDEGWFVATQGFNSPITSQDFYQGTINNESDLDNTNGVFALGNDDLRSLIGQCVCAVVYDSDVSMLGSNSANLQGDTLGLTAFKVIDVIAPGSIPESGSSSSLDDVLIELADPADVPGLCQIQQHDCDDQNSCTIDSCDSSTGFCEHTFEPEDENCSATIGTEIIIDCVAGNTTICYDVHTSTNPELSHESICVPDGVPVSGTGTAPCQQTEYGPDGSIEYDGTVFKFECNGNIEQPWSGQFCLTFAGIYEISEDNLAWVKRGRREEETRTLGIAACGSPPVVSDICTSAVTITISLDPTSSKVARSLCTDSELRSQLAEVADVPLFYVTVLVNEDDLVVATFLDSPTASASEAALAVMERIGSDDVPSCFRNAETVELIDGGGSTLYETSLSTNFDSPFSTGGSPTTAGQEAFSSSDASDASRGSRAASNSDSSAASDASRANLNAYVLFMLVLFAIVF